MFTRVTVAVWILTASLAGAELRFADLGDLKLESGQVIRDCRIGYRLHGRLNADKSNAVLWPTWFGGATEDLEDLIGPGKLIDDTKYFVITVDALGNGVSSSPSNSRAQPGARFPRFSIGDMVRSQHRLLTEVLGLKKLHAVMGISMGGMQTFEWIVAYPDFMDKAVPMVGTPRQTTMDLLLWGAELGIIEQAQRCHCSFPEAMKNVGRIHTFALTTPDNRVRETPREEFGEEIGRQLEDYAKRNPYDWASQLRAMMDLDVSRRFGGSMEKAAAAVKAEVFVVVARRDHMVNPHPALRFARLLGADTLILGSDCGHISTGCEARKLNPAVAAFLGE